MFAFFDTIINLISSVITFLSNSIKMIVQLFGMTVQGVLYLQSVSAYLPSFVLPFILSIILIAVFKFILSLGSR